MYIGRVTGTVVSTVRHKLYNGHKLLIVTRLDLEGNETAAYDIAVDQAQAGVGDVVVVMDEGSSARQLLRMHTGPIRAVVVGVVDDVTLAT